jgi:dsDNA-binding SOS-regulon protein
MFSLPLIGDDNKNEKSSEIVEQLVSMVTSILQGKDYSEFKENISPEAYIIYNNTYESIFEVLENSSKKEIFIEGKEAQVEYVHLWMPDDQKATHLVFRTKNSDNGKTSWHSILFKIGENQKWQIISWHKS